MNIFKNLGIELDIVLLVCVALILILFVLCIVLFSKLSSLRSRYDGFMEGQDGASLEASFAKKFENMDYINQKLLEVDTRLNSIDTNLLATYQKVGIVKYDAFQEVGGTMSFVLTLLTKDNDGFILNSMHSNSEGCYIYVKEVKKGETFVSLSNEETQSLQNAINNI